MGNTAWIDECDASPSLTVGDTGFLLELYEPGREPQYRLRAEARNGVLEGDASAPGDQIRYTAMGLATIARQARNGRYCLRRLYRHEITPELAARLGIVAGGAA